MEPEGWCFWQRGQQGQRPRGKLGLFKELEECQCAWSTGREGKIDAGGTVELGGGGQVIDLHEQRCRGGSNNWSVENNVSEIY